MQINSYFKEFLEDVITCNMLYDVPMVVSLLTYFREKTGYE